MIDNIFNFAESSDMIVSVAQNRPIATAIRAFTTHHSGSHIELHESIQQPGMYLIIEHGQVSRVREIITDVPVDQVYRLFFRMERIHE
jgi:hypothetical protein